MIRLFLNLNQLPAANKTHLRSIPTNVFGYSLPRMSEISEKNWSTKSFLTSHLWYKAMLKVWKKSWKPFRLSQLTSTANPAIICQIGLERVLSCLIIDPRWVWTFNFQVKDTTISLYNGHKSKVTKFTKKLYYRQDNFEPTFLLFPDLQTPNLLFLYLTLNWSPYHLAILFS